MPFWGSYHVVPGRTRPRGLPAPAGLEPFGDFTIVGPTRGGYLGFHRACGPPIRSAGTRPADLGGGDDQRQSSPRRTTVFPADAPARSVARSSRRRDRGRSGCRRCASRSSDVPACSSGSGWRSVSSTRCWSTGGQRPSPRRPSAEAQDGPQFRHPAARITAIGLAIAFYSGPWGWACFRPALFQVVLVLSTVAAGLKKIRRAAGTDVPGSRRIRNKGLIRHV